MGATLTLGLDRPPLFNDAREPHDRGERPASADASRHARTLDDVLVGALDALSSHHTVTCPVCSGKMLPRYGSGARPVGGRCQRCGSSLG